MICLILAGVNCDHEHAAPMKHFVDAKIVKVTVIVDIWIEPPTCGRDHIEGLIPNTTADFSKLTIESLIAGFSERLVPDMLDRLASNKK